MKKNGTPTLPANEIWTLHLDGKLLCPDVWRYFSVKYGDNCLYGWRAPKKVYYKRHLAKSAIHHLPKQIRDRVEIVRYVPAVD